MPTPKQKPQFSNELESWLKSGSEHKTLGELEDVFAHKSAPIGILILMAFPALPIPTGGLSHVFEVIAAALALGMMANLNRLWLPKNSRKTRLTGKNQAKFIAGMIQFIRFFEKFSHPRLSHIVAGHISRRFIGFVTLIFTAFAFFSPPFSFLDTLPAMGVVIMMLGIILEDILLLLVGFVVGVFGCALAFVIASSVYRGLLHLV